MQALIPFRRACRSSPTRALLLLLTAPATQVNRVIKRCLPSARPVS